MIAVVSQGILLRSEDLVEGAVGSARSSEPGIACNQYGLEPFGLLTALQAEDDRAIVG